MRITVSVVGYALTVDPGAARPEPVPFDETVERDEPMLEVAIGPAPKSTTIRLFSGKYEGDVTGDEPLTVSGPGARLHGDGKGSVVAVTADHVALVGLTTDGVGNKSLHRTADDDTWDSTVQQAYGNSDAGVTLRNASWLYVRNLPVTTPGSGFVLRRTPGAVIQGVTVVGTDSWDDWVMGVVGMHARIVVQGSTFDGVYLYRAHGTVVRNNTVLGGRFDTHLLYASRALIADNTAREQLYAGSVVMTNPRENAIVGNDIRPAGSGIIKAGARSYVADNVVVEAGRALSASKCGVRTPSNLTSKTTRLQSVRYVTAGVQTRESVQDRYHIG